MRLSAERTRSAARGARPLEREVGRVWARIAGEPSYVVRRERITQPQGPQTQSNLLARRLKASKFAPTAAPEARPRGARG
jgi:hypothetical protein